MTVFDNHVSVLRSNRTNFSLTLSLTNCSYLNHNEMSYTQLKNVRLGSFGFVWVRSGSFGFARVSTIYNSI